MSTESTLTRLEVADLDGDGLPDLVGSATGNLALHLHPLRNRGDGTIAGRRYRCPRHHRELREGDLSPFAALLRAAEVVRVGKGTTFGLGKLKIVG